MGTIEYIVTDMGNGAAFCSECGYCLDNGNPMFVMPAKCPECDTELVKNDVFINMGGSDF